MENNTKYLDAQGLDVLVTNIKTKIAETKNEFQTTIDTLMDQNAKLLKELAGMHKEISVLYGMVAEYHPEDAETVKMKVQNQLSTI